MPGFRLVRSNTRKTEPYVPCPLADRPPGRPGTSLPQVENLPPREPQAVAEPPAETWAWARQAATSAFNRRAMEGQDTYGET